MQNLSKILIILAAATLPFKYGPIYAWPFVFFIIAAAALKLISIASDGIKNELAELFFWTKILFFFFIFLILGSANSWLIYGMNHASLKGIAIDLLLSGIYATGFLLILSYGADLKFRKRIFAGLMSPLIFAPFVLMPELAKKLGFVSGVNMFEGLQKGEPTSFAGVMLIPFIALVAFFIREAEWKRKFFCILGIILASSLIFWSGVRSSWFAAGLSALLILIFEIRRRKTGRLKFAAATLSSLAAAAIVSFIILPHDAKISILNRIFPQVTDYTYSEGIINNISLHGAFGKIYKDPELSFPYQNRDLIWPQAAKLLAKNPFGLGSDYHTSSRAIMQDGQVTRAHNLFLDVGLQGGIGALAIYLFFIWKQISRLRNAKEKNEEWLILGVAFLSLFILAFVNGIFFRNDLFIAALILSLGQIVPVPDSGKNPDDARR